MKKSIKLLTKNKSMYIIIGWRIFMKITSFPLFFTLLMFGISSENIKGLDNGIIKIVLTEINVPNGIVYNKVSEEVNITAVNYIVDLIDGERIIENSPRIVMVGPRLWRSFEDYEEMAGSPTMIMTYVIPMDGKMYEVNGAAVRFEERTYYVMKIFHDLFKEQELTIRKLNENELRYYWRICSYDLNEPLFTVETLNVGKYIFHFFDDEEILFIEDISGLQ
jgi:hypothetical protein